MAAENKAQDPKTQRRKAGLIVVWVGVGILGLGYLLLGKGDITVSPFLIVGSFGVMATGIWLGWD